MPQSLSFFDWKPVCTGRGTGADFKVREGRSYSPSGFHGLLTAAFQHRWKCAACLPSDRHIRHFFESTLPVDASCLSLQTVLCQRDIASPAPLRLQVQPLFPPSHDKSFRNTSEVAHAAKVLAAACKGNVAWTGQPSGIDILLLTECHHAHEVTVLGAPQFKTLMFSAASRYLPVR